MRVDHCGGVVRRSLLCVLAALGALALVPAALGGTLSGSVALDPAPAVDLTGAGAIDWAIWGYAGGGTSTTLTPDVRKLGGKAIGTLTNIDPAPSAPLRGIGQFAGPYAFSWTNGAPTGSASGVRAGLQHNGGPPPAPLGADVSTLGKGFSFDVPAGTAFRTLKVYVATNRAAGQLTASLSDGSAADYVNTLPARDRHPVGDLHAHLRGGLERPEAARLVDRDRGQLPVVPLRQRRDLRGRALRPDRRQHERRPR